MRSSGYKSVRFIKLRDSAEVGRAAKHVIFVGRVQGVGFRFTAHRIASRHFLTGFVRNAADGSVEMVAQGESGDVDECIREIKDALPGHVREARITDVPFDSRYSDFRITF
ncbi:MAG: acylphosphatase [Sedimentisphaerales bacterium]|nr:acylphosphatase [Sedimentisphaerales bacterium]